MYLKNLILCATLFISQICSPGQVKSQNVIQGNTNSWFLQFSRFELSEKWTFTNELHYRTGAFLSNPGLILIRPSIDFHLNKELEFSVGYTFVYADPFEPYSLPIPAVENNLWWQAWIKNKIGNTRLQHRFREEHRWQDKIVGTSEDGFTKDGMTFSNRFRYRFTVDFNFLSFSENRAIFCVLFDEVWLTQNSKLLFTDLNRNWLYGGLGYRFHQNANVQLGFNYQSDKIGDGEFINSPVVQLSYFQTFILSSDSN